MLFHDKSDFGIVRLRGIGLAPAVIALGLTLGLTVSNAYAEEAVGRVKIARGDAVIVDGNENKPAKAGTPIYAGTLLKTGSDGRLGVTFNDATRFALGPSSEVAVDDFVFNTTTHEGSFNSRINKGSLSVISGKIAKAKPDAMTLRTPTTVLGVRGTNFLIQID